MGTCVGEMDLDDLLLKTSRTFALAIPMLPEPTRREVSVAYLLFRIADTFEDATTWPRAERIAALNAFADAVTKVDVEGLKALTAKWLLKPPHQHAGYLELLKLTPEVVGTLSSMTPGARDILIKHTVRTSKGMADVVARADAEGNLQLESVEDLKAYCYIVAGIVGELLTDVFLHDTPQLASVRETLTKTMVEFGEGLQLVNILKDTGDDARDGRAYLPKGVDRDEVLELARADLDAASRYIDALQRGGAPKGYLGFTGISVMLARAALKVLENDGPGAKVSRLEVARLMGQLQATLASGASMLQATA
ncbi:MAG: squalene/phytoene synthase family protein [Myxococcaceae bacterium]|nr:squalene/phytoene synthase family protein [Myxococcaceae bacterium]